MTLLTFLLVVAALVLADLRLALSEGRPRELDPTAWNGQKPLAKR